MSVEPKKVSQQSAFVDYTIKQIASSNGIAANLRKSDNPATEHYSWDFLVKFNVPLEYDDKRIPYTLVAAAIARDKASKNGHLGLGKALALSYPDGSESKPAQAKLRRLLACNDIVELGSILRQTLSLIRSRVDQPLDYSVLLGQLLRYSFSRDKVNLQWAQQFYAVGNETQGDK
jgi:CRISPR system Cascade subunit CasB